MNNIHPAIAQALKAYMPPRKQLKADLETTVAGMPAGIKIDRFFVQKPMGRMADSDLDCFGYKEIEFTVLDRKGYVAPWLQSRMTAADIDRIETMILEAEEA